MLKKLITALLSSFVFCAILAFLEYDKTNERYFSYSGLLIIGTIFAIPYFVVVGIPFSMLIEAIAKRIALHSKIMRYFLNVALYILAGIVVCFILIVINGQSLHRLLEINRYPDYIIASLLFYHILLLIKLTFKKIKPSEF